MKKLLFDLETDNLLEACTTIHCGVIIDMVSQEVREYRPHEIENLFWDLLEADELWGHNIIAFDIPVLFKMADKFLTKEGDAGFGKGFEWIEAFKEKFHGKEGIKVIDSMVLSRLVYSDIKAMDWENIKKGRMVLPAGKGILMKTVGSHSLKAWGFRLGYAKGQYLELEGFDTFTEGMMEYCTRDGLLNLRLINTILKRNPSQESIILEHQFYRYLQFQQNHGVKFDVEFAEWLVGGWQRELERRMVEMRALVPNIVKEWEYTPKVNNKKFGYEKGTTITKRKVIEFNPRSSEHVTEFLIQKYGWQPQEFNKPTKDKDGMPSKKWPNGSPQVTYEILKGLKYKEAPLLARIKVLMDRIDLVKGSKQSWLNCVHCDGRIYGSIIHNGTNTHRCRHMKPNLGNVVSPKSLWGHVVRMLFIASGQPSRLKGLRDTWVAKVGSEEGCPFPETAPPKLPRKKLLGTDFDALEMRGLAEVLWDIDGGAFAEMALNGDKSKGTDPHTLNLKAVRSILKSIGLGKVADELDRELIKTAFYAWLYGAFPKRLGLTIGQKTSLKPHQFYKAGQAVLQGFASTIPGIAVVITELEAIYDEQTSNGIWPHLIGLDGRQIPVRKKSALLNTLLQTMGAVLAKKAPANMLEELGDPGTTWWPVLHVHDEVQNEVLDERQVITEFKRVVDRCFRRTGEHFEFRVPILGTTDEGLNWAETH